ncbi:HD-GYP domain-containing protein [Neobacillus sp. Marseille-QA0830]
MSRKINYILNRPVYFRYGFFAIVIINFVLYFYDIEQNHSYVFYILATAFLGFGFYELKGLFLVTLTTVIVFARLLFGPGSLSLLAFAILEPTYLLINLISVGLMKQIHKNKEDSIELITALSKTLDSRDTYTSDHSQNAAKYAVEIAQKMGLPKRVVEAVSQGGLLHDIGKIGIPEEILMKPGSLTEQEYSIIKKHPLIGYGIIKHVSSFKENGVLDLVLYHHERYDGKGYPQGLKGEQIPLVARIMAIADSFDAMTSKRVYRNAIDLEKTLEEIKRNKGTQFDPEITDVFLSLFTSTTKIDFLAHASKEAEEPETILQKGMERKLS